MTDDIAGALRGFAESQRVAASTSAPDPALESGGLARRVGRRRAVRMGSTVLSTAAVVGAAAAAVLLSGSGRPQPPALPAATLTSTPSPAGPTASETPTASATVAPSATPTPTAAELRDAAPMSPGMLEAADEGWRIVQYSARDEQEEVLVPATLYLLDPDGQPYVVPTAANPAEWYLLDWLPGSALVVAESRTDGATRVMDLLTGESGPAIGYWLDDAQFAGDGSDDVVFSGGTVAGIEVVRAGADAEVRARTAMFGYQYGSANWLRSPDGTWIALNDVAGPRAVATDRFTTVVLPAPYPNRPDACRAWMWVDDSEVLMECAPAGGTAFDLGSGDNEFWLVPVDAGAPRQLVGMPIPERLGGVWRVGDRLVAGMFGPSEREASWWAVTTDGLVPLSAGGSPELSVFDVRGSELLATLRPYSVEGEPTTPSIVAIDPVRGTTRTLAEGEAAWFTGLAVVPGRFAGLPQTTTGD